MPSGPTQARAPRSSGLEHASSCRVLRHVEREGGAGAPSEDAAVAPLPGVEDDGTTEFGAALHGQGDDRDFWLAGWVAIGRDARDVVGDRNVHVEGLQVLA